MIQEKLSFGCISQDFHEVLFDIIGKRHGCVAEVDNAIGIAAVVANQDIVQELVLVDDLKFMLWLLLEACMKRRNRL